MTRLWLRIAIATVAIVATLVVAVDTFVIGPAADQSARAVATAAATEATLVAQLVRQGGSPPGGAIVLTGRTRSEAASGSAPIGDGRFVQVPLREQGALVETLWRGLLLVIGTGALAGAGWALWVGVARARDLGSVCRALRDLGGGEAAPVVPARAVSIEHLARVVEGLRATLAQQVLSQAELVGIMAHDLRSPLTGICLASDWLERSQNSADRARARGQIQRECDRLAVIADDVLQLCKDAHANTTDTQHGVAADQLLLDVVDRLRSSGSGSQQVHVVSALTTAVRVDSSIARAVANLAENAARHAPPGTQVSLAVRQTEAGAVEFAVEDEGPGFAPELLECAFAQGGTSPGRAGLGLSSVRRVVAAAGGASQLERRDRGTRVVLQVPQLDRGL